MWWLRSTEDAPSHTGTARLAGVAGRGTRLATAGALLLMVACVSVPPSAPTPASRGHAPAGSQGNTAAGGAARTEGEASAAPATGPNGTVSPAAPPPARAVADFGRAVGLMRSGNAEEAELEFEQIATSYPQLAAPDIDLGLLYRKSGDLDRSERSLRRAVERDPGSAIGWCELGVTLRMRGKFHDAEDAYKRAIAADQGFAPAYRNLGVLLDLYLGDAPGALDALEHYQKLTGEKEPVRGWIAELRRRAGKRPAERSTTEAGPAATGASAGASPPAGAPPGGSAPVAGKTGD